MSGEISGTPVVIKTYKQRFLLGLVKIDYHVENRRPDLNNNYKHFLVLTVCGKQYRWTFRTEYPYEELPWTD